MSFDEGSGFFSAVSAGFREVLSNSLTAVRLEKNNYKIYVKYIK